jgi:hypothetical protein
VDQGRNGACRQEFPFSQRGFVLLPSKSIMGSVRESTGARAKKVRRAGRFLVKLLTIFEFSPHCYVSKCYNMDESNEVIIDNSGTNSAETPQKLSRLQCLKVAIRNNLKIVDCAKAFLYGERYLSGRKVSKSELSFCLNCPAQLPPDQAKHIVSTCNYACEETIKNFFNCERYNSLISNREKSCKKKEKITSENFRGKFWNGKAQTFGGAIDEIDRITERTADFLSKFTQQLKSEERDKVERGLNKFFADKLFEKCGDIKNFDKGIKIFLERSCDSYSLLLFKDRLPRGGGYPGIKPLEIDPLEN